VSVRSLRLQTPVIGSSSALAMSVHPTYFDLATPLVLLVGSRIKSERETERERERERERESSRPSGQQLRMADGRKC